MSSEDLEDGELSSSDDEGEGHGNNGDGACSNGVKDVNMINKTEEEFPAMLESGETSRKRPFESPEPPELQKDVTDVTNNSTAKVGVL